MAKFSLLSQFNFYLLRYIPALLLSFDTIYHTFFLNKKYDVIVFAKSYPSESSALKSWYYFFKYRTSLRVLFCKSLSYRDFGQKLNIIYGAPKRLNTVSHRLKVNVSEINIPYILNESSLLGRGPVVADGSCSEWYRIGLNGFLADDPSFLDHYPKGTDRLAKIIKAKNVLVHPWRPGNKHVLIALQMPNDASLRGINICEWAYSVASRIRSLSDVKIVVRTPQIQRTFDPVYMGKIKSISNLYIQAGSFDNLDESLSNSFFTCTYSSGLGIDSVLRGIPVVVTSPASFVYDLSSGLSEALNSNYFMPDRSSWLEKLSWREFSLDDIETGDAWSVIQKVQEYFS